jgi:cbb3-type cytochrome oxidase subunit 3
VVGLMDVLTGMIFGILLLIFQFAITAYMFNRNLKKAAKRGEELNTRLNMVKVV